MGTTARVVAAGCLIALVAVVVGCSSSDPGPPNQSGGIPTFKIDEYVGDGNGATKPSPFAALSGDAVSAVATPLGWGKPPQVRTTTTWRINWFRLPAGNVNSPVIITMQPTADEDADLYILKGGAHQFLDPDGAVLGSSVRAPSLGSDPVFGYVPDWVAIIPGAQGALPCAQVAAYGVDQAYSTQHFTLEADKTRGCVPNGGNFVITPGQQPLADSLWFRFNAKAGTQYTVWVYGVFPGCDPDLYVYGSASTEFVGKSTGMTDESVTFTASHSDWHYARVYGLSPTQQYKFRVDSP